MLFICYPKCTTCQKAARWLEERGISVTVRNIKTDNPTQEELRRWHALAACVLPQIDALGALEREALAQWQKAALRRGRTADLPPMLQKWLGEIASLPGFREEYSISPILQDWIFSWIAQVLL